MAITGLIAGLGNPGPRYENTRHNFGFLALDSLCLSRGSEAPCSGESVRSNGLIRRLPCRDGEWLLVKPQTYMNLSGQCVGEVARYFKIEPDHIVVVHDELDLPLGRLQLRVGGGSAGHKGVDSIAQHLGTRDFIRLRLGIGKPRDKDVHAYVLDPFLPGEITRAREVLSAAAHGLELFLAKGLDTARQWVNSQRLEDEP